MKTNIVDLYLTGSIDESYVNTKEENELVNKFSELYNMAKNAKDSTEECKPENLEKWRKAYEGTLNALTRDGTESKKKSRQLRKMVYEIVESKVDNSIPMPKIQPRYKSDLPLVSITENYLKFEADRILTRYENDRSERATYIDGTGWYKVWWDSFENTHERSGNVRLEFCTVDQIIPQPGVKDYKQLEYLFERQNLSASKIWKLYHKNIKPVNAETNVIEIINCYYINDEGIVGLFTWAPHSLQVIRNEEDWQIRKLRKCKTCNEIVPQSSMCPVCGSKKFKYEVADTEVLSEDLMEIYNPYEVGETEDENLKDKYEARKFLTAGTSIPFYRIRQLPFVPRPAVSSINNLYGISEVKILLDMQDAVNKILTKAVDKTLKSGAVVTKPNNVKINDTDDTMKILTVKSAEEAQMVQTKQIVADTSTDLLISNMIYDSGKASSGVTNSFQGQKDTTATSGKAKEYAAMQSAGRIESLRVMKAAAFAGVYELLLKYLLAFSDESRKFVRTLPDGTKKEEVWNKYMFLSKDKYGEVYYRDDFHFNSDPASTLSQNRVQMWRETTDKFVQGAFGNPSDPRVLKMYWNVMDSLQYPLAKIVLAGIEDNEQHLPYQIEQALMQNPQLLQELVAILSNSKSSETSTVSTQMGNNATHAANVEKTNERNRAKNRNTGLSALEGGNYNANKQE